MPIARLGAGGTNSKRSNLHAPNTGASFAGLRPGLGRAGVTKMFSLVGKGGGTKSNTVFMMNQVGGIGRGTARKCGGPPCNVTSRLAQVKGDGLTHAHDQTHAHDHTHDHDHDLTDDHDHDHDHDQDLTDDHDHEHDNYQDVGSDHPDTFHDIDDDDTETSIDKHLKDEVTKWVYNHFQKYSLSTPLSSKQLIHYILHEVRSLSGKDKHMTFHKSMKDSVLSHIDDSEQLLCHDLECATPNRVLIKSKTLEHLLYDNEQLDENSCVSYKIVYGDNTLTLHFIRNMYIDVLPVIDADGDGQISLDELIAFTSENTDFSPEDANSAFEMIDINQNGVLDNKDFLPLDTSGDGSVDTQELYDGISLHVNKKHVIKRLMSKVTEHLKKHTHCRSLFIHEYISKNISEHLHSMTPTQGSHNIYFDSNNQTAITVKDQCHECITENTVHTNYHTNKLHTPPIMLHKDTTSSLSECFPEPSADYTLHLHLNEYLHKSVDSFTDTWKDPTNPYHLLDVRTLVKNAMAQPNYDSTAQYLLVGHLPTLTTDCPGSLATYIKSKLWKVQCDSAGCQSLHACMHDEGLDSHTGNSTESELTCFTDYLRDSKLCHLSLVGNITVALFKDATSTESY